MQKEQHEYRFTGVFIPSEIFLDGNLNPIDKILWAEIDALNKNDLGCFATNDYLSSALTVASRTIKRSLKSLIDNGLLISQNDKKVISGRRLFAIKKTGAKMSPPQDKSDPPPPGQK